jgi:lambda family phage portal protein
MSKNPWRRRLARWLDPNAAHPAEGALAALSGTGPTSPARTLTFDATTDRRGDVTVVELRTLPAPAGAPPVVDTRVPPVVRHVRNRPPRARRSWRDYEAAGRGRNNEGWFAPNTAADVEIRKSLPLLRARSRELVRNNGYATRILSVFVANLIGEGIRPRSNTGDKKLDKRVNDLWDAWAKTADPFHGLDVYGVQALAVRSWLEGGDALIRFRLRRLEDGLAVPLQLEVLEGDMLDASLVEELPNGGRIVSGVEFDPINRRAAYWLLPFHPGDNWRGGGGYTARPVPASSVIHLFNPIRAGQVRGVPIFAPVAQDMRDLDDYEYAERVRKRIEACMVAFVIGNQPADADPSQDGIAPSVEDAEGNPIEEVSPGLIALVRDGKEVRVHVPAASPDYEAYNRVSVRQFAAGTGTTYEQVSGDLTGVNFASYKIGRVEFFRALRQLYRLILVPKVCDPVWATFTETAVAAGILPMRAAGYPVKHSEPRFESVERDKDATADKLEVRNGTRALTDVIASYGRDPEETLRAVSDAFALLDSLGLILDVDPRRTGAVGAGAAAGAPTDPETPPEPAPEPAKAGKEPGA